MEPRSYTVGTLMGEAFARVLFYSPPSVHTLLCSFRFPSDSYTTDTQGPSLRNLGSVRVFRHSSDSAPYTTVICDITKVNP